MSKAKELLRTTMEAMLPVERDLVIEKHDAACMFFYELHSTTDIKKRLALARRAFALLVASEKRAEGWADQMAACLELQRRLNHNRAHKA